jgi:hypothetical protein
MSIYIRRLMFFSGLSRRITDFLSGPGMTQMQHAKLIKRLYARYGRYCNALKANGSRADNMQ